VCFYLDVDPIKETIPLWYIPSERFLKADSCTALRQLNGKLNENPALLDRAAIDNRRAKVAALHP
jgi:acetolactate synthase-1/2/3 large subunit